MSGYIGECNRCQTDAKLTRYANHGLDKLLCSNCITELDDYYSLTCAKCGKPAHLRGNLLEYENQKICPVCMDEIKIQELES